MISQNVILEETTAELCQTHQQTVHRAPSWCVKASRGIWLSRAIPDTSHKISLETLTDSIVIAAVHESVLGPKLTSGLNW